MNIIKCYCDASYNPQTKIAVIGWKIGQNKIRDMLLTDTNNTRAEIIGLIHLINELDPNLKYIIHTDCQSILNRLMSKEKLIGKDFKNAKGEKLGNADLYQKLFEIVTENITLVHIDGHISREKMNEDNVIFSQLDKYVRRKLRIITNADNDK